MGTGCWTVGVQKTHRVSWSRDLWRAPHTGILSLSPMALSPQADRSHSLALPGIWWAGTLGHCRSKRQELSPGSQGTPLTEGRVGSGASLPATCLLLLSCPVCREQRRSVTCSGVAGGLLQITSEVRRNGNHQNVPQQRQVRGQTYLSIDEGWAIREKGLCAGTCLVDMTCCQPQGRMHRVTQLL